MTDTDDLARRIVSNIIGRAPFQSYSTKPPRSVKEAYVVQNAVTEILTETGEWGRVAGWKIAANAPALLKRFDIQEPLSGRVFSGLRHDSPASLIVTDYREFAFEPEIAAILGKALPPQDAPYDTKQVSQAIDRFVPAMELLDMRETNMAATHIPDVVAQNISNVGAVLGGPGVRPDALDTGSVRTVLTISGEIVHDVVGAAPQDPIVAVTWLANHLASRGLMLEVGNFVLCGTHSPIWYHKGSGEIRVEMKGLGHATLVLENRRRP